MENLKDKFRSLFHSRGCLGCCTKAPFVNTENKPRGGLKKGPGIKKASVTEDFWSSSPCDMDNSAAQSQVSVSSISMSNPNLDAHSSGGNPSEFVNPGLLLWNQTRQHWVGNKGTDTDNHKRVREPAISWNATYENLLGTSKPFPQPIPLPEMVSFLVDVWEQEGLYD